MTTLISIESELTDTQLSLLHAIKKHELATGEFCRFPRPSHMGMSLVQGYSSGKQIHSGFQQRTFLELVEKKAIVQTMFCGYRLADGMGGYCDLPMDQQLKIKQP